MYLTFKHFTSWTNDNITLIGSNEPQQCFRTTCSNNASLMTSIRGLMSEHDDDDGSVMEEDYDDNSFIYLKMLVVQQ